MGLIEVREVIDPAEWEALLQASLHEGYSIVQKLWEELQNGDYSQPKARLIGVYQAQELQGIGGILPDPYLDQAHIGRIRHVYILPQYRRLGLGAELIRALIKNSPFEVITLRTLTAHGDAFYRALGFRTEARFEHATHWLVCEQ